MNKRDKNKIINMINILNINIKYTNKNKDKHT